IASARRPVIVAGSDVYGGDAIGALRAAAEALRVPVFTNGMGRGALPPEHPLAFANARRVALSGADLVVVVGTPLDFRLGCGDFVSYAGRYLAPAVPGTWLDPGPYGCLGTGMGYAMGARLTYPDRQVCVLMGDGASGFSLMDVESLVRQRLPVVIVVGNNGIWGLEKHPMRAMYGYDVAADLQPGLRYDDVVRALGGAGETVAKAADLGPALERAFAAG